LQRIHSFIRKVFQAAVVHGMQHDTYGRALYGVDVMLDSILNPYIIEVSYCPDMAYVIGLEPKILADYWDMMFYGNCAECVVF
jgi:hypothetical protein